MKCIIAGSRSYAPSAGDSLRVCGEKLELIDLYVTHAALDSGYEISYVGSGRAKGIDSGGERWAVRHGIPIMPFPALWRSGGHYNPRAGFERNKRMRAWADCAIVIWDGESSGSFNMIEEMRAHRKPVFVYIPGVVNV